jgi:hypothetical protein
MTLCTAAVRTVPDPEMAEQLDRLGILVVFEPSTIADPLTVLRETLTAQEQLAAATEAMSGVDERSEGTRTQPSAQGRAMDTTRR